MSVGCLGYAAGGLWAARSGKELHPIVTTTWSLAYATVSLAILSFVVERPLSMRPHPDALLAIFGAGCLATALPNLIYYRLISQVGPQFASLFGYIVPLFGVLMGIALMHERITTWLFPGMVLILAGVALVRSPSAA